MTTDSILKHVNPSDLARLSKLHMELSDHVVVLTAIVGAMVTRASVDYERLVAVRLATSPRCRRFRSRRRW